MSSSYSALRTLFQRRADEMNFTPVVSADLESRRERCSDIAIDHGKPKAPTPFKTQSRMGLVDHVGCSEKSCRTTRTSERDGWIDSSTRRTPYTTAAEKLTIQTAWVTDPVEKGRLTTELR
jgi:hypothetical protein